MTEKSSHITDYKTLGLVLLSLLLLTCITIEVTSFDLSTWNVALALIIACVKVFIVLTFFMHLKYEKLLLKLLVGGVFFLFFLVVVITFIDYAYR
jgi:cytochrome c oxidase subunit IV